MAFFGRRSKADVSTPDGALQAMLDAVCDGNMEETMNVFQVSEGPRARVMGLPGVIRGYLGTYAKKLFKKSEFTIESVENKGANLAAVTVSGKTLDGEKTANDAVQILGTRGKEMGLFDGKKNIKMIGQALGLVNDVIDRIKIVPVRGVVHMEKVNGKWQIQDRDELTGVLVNASVSKLMPEMKAKFRAAREG